MFAIIRTGGKQYRVQAGDVVRVQRLEKKIGETFDLTDILMVGGDKSFIGSSAKNAKVTVTVVREDREAKITVFKKKRRKGYRRTQGHRQDFTEIFVAAITSPDGETVKADQKPQIIDPAKKANREQAHAEKLKAGGKKAIVAAKKKKASVKTAKKVKKATAAVKKAGAKKKASASKAKTSKKAGKKVAKKAKTATKK